MEVLSRAWQTDLALLARSGSQVTHHPTYVVVSTPDNPGYRWGNFVLLRRTPLVRAVPGVIELFDRHFPGARHQALGIDDPDGTRHDLDRFADQGFQVDLSIVLTADAVVPPPHPNASVQVRRLVDDADWQQRVALGIAADDHERGEEYVAFATRRAAAERGLAEDGYGAWFGAFDGPRMLSGLGIFRTGAGLARFQNVETHPEARGHGLAGTLVHAASQHALAHLGAKTLVIVADPDHQAIRVYRSVGFAGTETQLQVMRRRAG